MAGYLALEGIPVSLMTHGPKAVLSLLLETPPSLGQAPPYIPLLAHTWWAGGVLGQGGGDLGVWHAASEKGPW